MATFTRIQGNLTADDAREVGRGSSFLAATYYLDGREPVRVSRWEAPVNAENVLPGEVRPAVKLGSLLDHPDIAQDVRDHEKASLLAKKQAGAIRSAIRDRPNAPNGQTWEWDHWQLSLSREETAWLAAHADRRAEFQTIVAETMRIHPTATGTRQALITDIHDDTGAWHVQGLVSRYAMDYGQHPPVASTAVDLSNNSAAAELIRRMQERFTEAGMPFNVSRLYTNEVRSKLEDRGTSDAAKEAYRADVAAAGGEAGARSTVGPIPELPATMRAIANITPEVEKLELGARLAEDDGLKAAQRVEALKAELEAAEAARQAAAERRATFDQAIAAIGQKQAAEVAQAEAEARASAAQEAQEAALVALEAAQAEAAAAAAKAAQEATQAAELLLQEQNRADQAEGLAVQRFATIEELEAIAQGEPQRIAEAVEGALDPLREKIAQIREALTAETKARETAVAELAEERRTFPERVAAEVRKAVEEARATWDREIANPMRQELADARTGLEKAQALITEQSAAIAAIPRQIAEAVEVAEARLRLTIREAVEAAVAATRAAMAAPVQALAGAAQAVAERAGTAAQAVRGQEFYRTTPDRWTVSQRAQAEAAFRRDQAAKPTEFSGLTLDEYGQGAHEGYEASRKGKPKPKG